MEVAGTIGARQKAGRAAEQPGEDRGSGGEKAGLQPRAAYEEPDEEPNEEPDERPNAAGAAARRRGARARRRSKKGDDRGTAPAGAANMLLS
ncbi:hypothetical protein [Burkholderia pseudomallei]|uniref:hypothetical protein n=1 Tax=Burkholderia pseudomallei TaxID=28450 RepID=UPI00052A357C|nr:hypothetical protein [Burkholderia pseudomallei]AIV89662.1 hypothetical protein X995_2196 [Burkholderia pseudomallei B03]AIV96199.1 hypothetical protein X996_2148 [Burkholderia pseudomallei A79A]KGY00073.1 hypothetical protein Y023_3479 [Burkholderia pseudomallei A79D]KGY04402.1 hypothetical protein X997_1995 [Burkholderia pseudomallei A79C]